MNKPEIMTKKHDKKCPLAPRLRFPEFRDEWYSQALGAIASIIKEKAGDKKCTLMSIVAGVGLISQIEKFGKEIAGNQYKNYIILRKGDFAYNKSATKDYPQGFIALYTGHEIAAVPNSIFTCFKVQPESIVPAYLNYLFLGNFHGKWLRRYITVGARAHGSLSIDDDDLLSLPIPYPKGVSSLGEQQKIADCFSSLDERIAAETSKLHRLKDHKKGLLKQLFPAEGETLPQLRFPEFRDAGEWEKSSIKNIGLLKNGYAFKSQNYVEEGKYKIITIANVKSGKFYSENANKISQLPNDIQTHQILKNGDILISMTGNVGRVCRVDGENCLLNQRVGKIVPAKIHDMFLYHSLQQESFLHSMTLKAAGGAQGNLSVSAIQNYEIQIPEQIEEQQKIADCLSSLDELISAQEQKIDLLKDHKKGLMQQLFPRIDEVLA